jgi:predicted AAA+ superfamily ATPase
MDRTLEKELAKWKDSPQRHPLLLRGARQVGKTYLIEKFGKGSFSSFVSVNFEAQPEAIACFESLDPEEILLRLQLIVKQTIQPGKTLLFLDEIQSCPQAILALRYFKEKMPDLHIVGAGSLLEFALIEGKFSFPVGRIQFMYLKPLSFQEYVLARGKVEAWDQLSRCTLDSPPTPELHEEMMKLIKEYFLVGGMPAAVASFCRNLSLQESNQIQNILLSTYRADFSKYAPLQTQKYLKIVFDGMFQMIGQQFKYSKIDANIRSRELKEALEHLQWAGLIYFIYASSASGLPLASQMKRTHFKLLSLDIGLAQHALDINPQLILDDHLFQINRGGITEQFVGQELLAYTDPHQEGQLFYWQREKKGSDAEVDYLLIVDRQIIPIEVKAGSYGRLRSIQQFITEKHSALGVRISQHSLSYENGILSVPFYLIAHLPKLIKTQLG